MYVFQGENPSVLQVEMLNELMAKGDECTPRGKKIKELRPVSIEFFNPLRRVTFLRGRRINPFFQLAESLWIISGHSDVAFLDLFNKNMVNFSDDGVYFNASYGERIRSFGKNALHRVIYNPVDQLEDVYLKLTSDKDSRQATIIISHPQFDNSSYTVGEQGKDIACNLAITFKIRHNKLHMMVFNRSNDILWGLFGANLCQFTTLQELLASWLGVEVGSYHQVTDSLHLYTDTYGSSENEAIFALHPGIEDGTYSIWDYVDAEENIWWDFVTEPRMTMTKEKFDLFSMFFWDSIAPKLSSDEFITGEENVEKLLNVLHTDSEYVSLGDNYWRMAISAMFAYRLVRNKDILRALKVLRNFVPDCSWKVSMAYFLKTLIEKHHLGNQDVVFEYQELVDDFVASGNLKNDSVALEKYLDLEVSHE